MKWVKDAINHELEQKKIRNIQLVSKIQRQHNVFVCVCAGRKCQFESEFRNSHSFCYFFPYLLKTKQIFAKWQIFLSLIFDGELKNKKENEDRIDSGFSFVELGYCRSLPSYICLLYVFVYFHQNHFLFNHLPFAPLYVFSTRRICNLFVFFSAAFTIFFIDSCNFLSFCVRFTCFFLRRQRHISPSRLCTAHTSIVSCINSTQFNNEPNIMFILRYVYIFKI